MRTSLFRITYAQQRIRKRNPKSSWNLEKLLGGYALAVFDTAFLDPQWNTYKLDTMIFGLIGRKRILRYYK